MVLSHSSSQQKCPSCGKRSTSVFYNLENVPVHSVLLIPTQAEALAFPKGNLVLGFCQNCGFIYNQAFDPSMLDYSSRYDSTQAFSPTFNAYQLNLAEYLIEQYQIRDKSIIEIGCGQGEFLSQICEMGRNRGTGFDPAFIDNRQTQNATGNVKFIKDFYSEKYSHLQADFVCCKMTLEHIPETKQFIRMVRRTIGDKLDTIVFFQVPNVSHILKQLAFWDFYYEHCSYFSAGSISRLFRNCKFEILDLQTDYDDQYLLLIAKPSVSITQPHSNEENIETLTLAVDYFSKNYVHKLAEWRAMLNQISVTNQKAVVWGASSKTVALFSTMNIQQEIRFAVDINPRKHGTYIAGTAQRIVAPEFLQEYRPDVVIIMNHIYYDEIDKALADLGVSSKLIVI
jgi:2-polyprenyl-3-methyl-5-hydroxy-6-metoxy-1,4-benzoquinol methylase